jgi:chemotaxis protein methyltransferase CheR
MTPAELDFLAGLCRSRAGLRVDTGRAHLIENRLAPVARREGFADITELLAAIEARRDDKLAWRVVEAMAQAESSFFRDRAPFEHFENEMLPTLARLRGDKPVRIWSAACGAGQEPYSLAMLVEEMRGLIPGTPIEIIGSDISERSLEKAQTGLYTQFEVQRGLSARRLVRHFEKQDEAWALTPRIRQMVRWRRVNLIADLSALGRFDVIFCRNLISGLDGPYATRVLESLATALSDDGYLVLGVSEPAPIRRILQPLPGRAGVYARDPSFRAAA